MHVADWHENFLGDCDPRTILRVECSVPISGEGNAGRLSQACNIDRESPDATLLFVSYQYDSRDSLKIEICLLRNSRYDPL